jgi:hypothetical protein
MAEKRKRATREGVFVAWYKEDEWEKLRSVSADADQLEKTYEEWVAHARKVMRDASAANLWLIKVRVGVDELVAWCAEKGLRVDGQARAHFAAEMGRRLMEE